MVGGGGLQHFSVSASPGTNWVLELTGLGWGLGFSDYGFGARA